MYGYKQCLYQVTSMRRYFRSAAWIHLQHLTTQSLTTHVIVDEIRSKISKVIIVIMMLLPAQQLRSNLNIHITQKKTNGSHNDVSNDIRTLCSPNMTNFITFTTIFRRLSSTSTQGANNITAWYKFATPLKQYVQGYINGFTL